MSGLNVRYHVVEVNRQETEHASILLTIREMLSALVLPKNEKNVPLISALVRFYAMTILFEYLYRIYSIEIRLLLHFLTIWLSRES